MSTITKNGQKVGIIRSIGESLKISGTRGAPLVLKIGGIVLATGIVLKTALDTTSYAINSLLNTASLGYYNITDLVGEDAQSTKAKVISLGVAGAAGLITYAGMHYGVFRAKKAVELVGEHATSSAAEIYQKQEPFLQAKDNIKTQAKLEKLVQNQKPQGRTGAI